jgi:hypothetical protein
MNPRNLFTDFSPLSGLRSIAATLAALSVLLSGCVSTKYKMARENTPPPMLLNLAATQPPLEVALNMVIIYQGPGSWKRTAFWDEYVVTLHNQGDQPLSIASATLADPGGVDRAPGVDPWALEKESKTLERKYLDAGVAFVRYAGAGVVIVGVGAGASIVGAGGILAAGAGAAAATAVVATGVTLPMYYLTVWAVNSDNKAGIVAEFNRRRLALPLTLAPGETRIGSLFFPMVPSPRTLSLQWSSGTSAGDLTLPLESVHGLHVKAPAPASTGT